MTDLQSTRARPQRILRGVQGAKARVVLYSQDGDEQSLGQGETMVANVYDATTGLAVGSTDRATAEDGDLAGLYTCDLTAEEVDTLEIYRIDWSVGGNLRSQTWHAIVGGFYFSAPQLQERFEAVAEYDELDIRVAREWFESLCTNETGRAWTPMLGQESWYQVRGMNTKGLLWTPVRALRTLTVDDGDSVLGSDHHLDTETGIIRLIEDVFYEECNVVYEHGMDAPNEHLREAAMVAVADRLLRRNSGISDRTRSQTNDLGLQIQYSYPGPGHPTGLDFVDQAILANDHRVPGFG